MMASVPMFSTATHERDVPSNAPNEWHGPNAPGLTSISRKSNDSCIGEDVHGAVQLGNPIGSAAIPNDGVAKPGFHSLKVALSVVSANYKVCLQFAAKSSTLTDSSTGNRCRRKHSGRSPL